MNNQNNSKEKILIKNTLLYTISNFGSKVLVFLIVPLYTYYLTTSEYGEYDTLLSIIQLISPLCMMAINEGLLRWLLKSKEKDKDIIFNGFLIYTIFIIITYIVLGIVYLITHWKYSMIMGVSLTFCSLNMSLQFCTRGVKKNIQFAVSGIIQTLSMIGFNIVLVVVLKTGIYGMLYSYIISQALSSGYLIFSLRNYISLDKKRMNKKLIRSMFLYSIMLVPNNISWWIMNSSDKIMLSSMLGTTFTGIYSISTKFPSVVNMIHSIFYSAWQEQAVIEYDSLERDKYYSKIFNIYMKLIFFFVILMIPISKLFIVLLMNTGYKDAYKYVGLLMLGAIFCAFSGFYGTGYISGKDTKNAALTTTIGAMVNVLINLLFIKSIGIWAACISTVLGYLTTWIIRIIQTRQYFNINVKWGTFTMLLFLSVLYSIVNLSNECYSPFVMLIIGIVVISLTSKEEISMFFERIINKLSKRKNK